MMHVIDVLLDSFTRLFRHHRYSLLEKLYSKGPPLLEVPRLPSHFGPIPQMREPVEGPREGLGGEKHDPSP